MPVWLYSMSFGPAAEAGICMVRCCNLPQSIIAPCRPDQGDPKRQDRRRVARFGQMLRALRHLTCNTCRKLDAQSTYNLQCQAVFVTLKELSARHCHSVTASR